MSDVSAIALAPIAPQAAAQPTAAEVTKRRDIHDTAQKFEASFLSIMLQQMYAGVETDGPFGGGAGEEMFRSFMTEAMAKQVSRSGGLGIADTVAREMLKLQGLSEEPHGA